MKTKIKKIIIFNLIIIFLCFLVLEIIARVQDVIVNEVPFFNTKMVFFKQSAYLPAVPVPNYQRLFYTHNSAGFRGKEFSKEKNQGVYRIVCLGGSAVYGVQLSDSQTYPAQLERLLNSYQDKITFQVINAGVTGYTTMESLINLVTRILPLNPDMIIIYHGYNDFKPNRFPGFEPDYTHWRIRETLPERHLINILSSKISFVRNLMTLQLKIMRKYNLYFSKCRRFHTVSDKGVSSFIRNLKNMIYIARGNGIVPVISTFSFLMNKENLEQHPDKFKDLIWRLPNLSYQGILDAKTQYNDVIREVAREQKVLLVDNASLIPESLDYLFDHCHFTAEGAILLAKNFAKAILEYLEIKIE